MCLLRVACAGLILAALSTSGIVAYFYLHYARIVDERLAAGYLTSRAGIYAAPRVLRAGQRISQERLVEMLRRAGYVEGETSNVWSGRFSVEPEGVEIRPRLAAAGAPGADSASACEVVRVRFDARGRIAALEGDGAPLDAYPLEPEPLTNDAAMKTGERHALAYGDLPPVLVHAILSIEDRRFFEHTGVDVTGVVRALLSWGDAGQGEPEFRQGGSTITQQLVKNTYLTPERTLRRKFHEAILALVLERRLSKQDILALYCDEIYLGERGGIGVRGVAEAARVFFGKELRELTLPEAATIAGMIQSPGRFAPDRHPEAARARRDVVLAAMLRDGWLTPDEARAATDAPVEVAPAHDESALAPYFIDYVSRLAETREATAGERTAPRVETTIDLELQRLAETAVRRQLAHLDETFKGRRTPQAALVALDPRTGDILALVGGRSYADSQLNRATDARRQPGSVFKPIVYAAAMESGISPLSLSLDAPREFVYDGRATYRPSNYGGRFSMHDVTLRHALVHSLNVVTVDVALRTGLGRVAGLAAELGLPKPEARYPALALGAAEATPLEVAAAYAAFANGGRLVRPNAVARTAQFPLADAQQQVLKPSTSYMLTDMLSDVIEEGTARAARGMLKGMAVAGKTGTSRDGWFAGYTPNLVCVVWVGFDDGTELGLTGAESALPVWTEFVRGAVELRPELGGESFARPAGVTSVEIDPETGALATEACPQRERVAVTPAFVPGAECLKHLPPLEVLAPVEVSERQAADAPSDGPASRAAAPDETWLHGVRAAFRGNATELRARPAVATTVVTNGLDARPRLTNELRLATARLP